MALVQSILDREPILYTMEKVSRIGAWKKIVWCLIKNAVNAVSMFHALPMKSPVDLECYEGNGDTYRGTADRTISGKQCQAWSSEIPHNHTITPDDFPNGGLENNYCRNPDGDKGPWCYTTDPSVTWEYCDLKKCSELKYVVMMNPVQETNSTTVNSSQECIVNNGKSYRGTKSTTSSGYTCQDWSAQSPQEHASFTPTTHPDAGLEKNYCRNPDGDVDGPWCYITNSDTVKFDYCDIPQCVTPVEKPGRIECGIPMQKQKKCNGKIVGGCEANPFSWPWQISLRTRTGYHFCGGSLIARQWVMTAAHCLKRSSEPSKYKVYLGIHHLYSVEASKQIRLVEKLFKGPTGADIALLKLKSPALMTDEVLPICLPTYGYMVTNTEECYVTGWGETQGTGDDHVLNEVAIPVMSNEECNSPEFLNNRVKSEEICGGNIEGGVDSCQGDSGGPFACFDGRKYILQGVTSWGIGCALQKKPGVYARVSMYTQWIEKTMREN
ncbi:plasminogen-like [Rhinophrynus dorsalis]